MTTKHKQLHLIIYLGIFFINKENSNLTRKRRIPTVKHPSVRPGGQNITPCISLNHQLFLTILKI